MGLFSRKKTVSVASSVYNMAGDEANRTDYVKSTIVGSVLSKRDSSLGEVLVNSIINGPAIQQRSMFNWANTNFQDGVPKAQVRSTVQVDPSVIEGEITVPAGQTLIVQSSFIEAADYGYLAEKYIFANKPELINTNWTSDYISSSEEVVIQYEDTTTDIVDVTGYNDDSDYLVAYYYFVKDSEEGVVSSGSQIIGDTDYSNLTDVSTYTLTSGPTIEEVVLVDLVENTLIEVTYSDSTPDESSSSDEITPDTYNKTREIYQKESYQGTDGVNGRTVTLRNIHDRLEYKQVTQTQTVTVENEDMGGGVTKTTTTTVTTDSLTGVWDHRDDTQELYSNEAVGGTQMVFYELGSGGNATYDALESDPDESVGEFFPFITLRIKNNPINEDDTDFETGFYEKQRAAYKKATGNNIDDLLEDIEENPDVGDIDHCFITYAVSLNVVENAGRKYLYEFFQGMIPYTTTTSAEYDSFKASTLTYAADLATYNEWYDAQSDPNDPLYETPAPNKPSLKNPEYTTIRVNSDVTTQFDHRYSWIAIDEETFTGVAKSGMVRGDVELENGPDDEWEEEIGVEQASGDNKSYNTNTVNTLYIYKQTGDNTYSRLTIKGLIHQNFVYDGRDVRITSKEALEDTEESGFLIPMHYPTLRRMSIVDATQITTANTFLIFNSYQVTRQKWWQTGFFKLVLIVAVAVITVAFAPAGAVTGGVLGTNVAVGAAIGFTGTTALLVGAAVNAIAAMVLVNIITEVSVGIFGEKIGNIVAVIASFVTINGITNMATNGQLGMDWGSMMRAENITKLTDSAINAYSAWTQGEIKDTYEQMQADLEEYESAMAEIDKLNSDLLRGSGLNFDPTQLTDTLSNSEYVESSDQFMSRTLMTGSDIADLSFDMIYKYTDINLQLPKIGE